MIDDDSLKSIENLHRMKGEGIITEEEFERSKERILFGQRQKALSPSSSMAALPRYTGELPGPEDHLGWILLPLRRYADFNGRSSRKEFWLFQLVPLGLFLICAVLAAMMGGAAAGLFLLGLLGIAVPQLAVQVRRFHDQDKSGWFALLNLIPYVGVLVVLVMMVLPGTSGDNRFGPDPLLQ